MFRKTASSNRRLNPANALGIVRAARCALEPLERRTMLCAFHVDHGSVIELRPDLLGDLMGGPEAGEPADIRWVNRANTTTGGGADTDGFGAVFGANANAARAVVDQVIADYERMITSFNYSDNSSIFNLTVSMGGGQGLGGGASTTNTLGGKPKAGQLTLQTGTNGAGAGWFIDPTPNDHAEFLGGIVNAFAADAQGGSPAAGLGDFYTVAAAEVAHALGLGTNSSLWNNRNTNTNIADNAEGGGIGTFYVFQGGSIQQLLTSNNGGPNGSSFNRAIHTAGSGGNINFNGTNWRGVEDAGNAAYEFGRRYLVPNVLGLMFQDAYGYSVNVTQRDSFYSVLNRNTGVLTIRGGTNNSADLISIHHVADNRYFRVSVDVGNDVAGTGALPGAGNLPAFVSGLYDANQINSIVINAGDGNDTININFLSELNALTINAGSGNDTINFAASSGNMDDTLNLNVTVNGDSGTDTLVFHDTANARNDPFTVTSTSMARSFLNIVNYNGVETLRINAGGGNNTINVQTLLSTSSLQINAGNGNDTINIGGTLNNVENVKGNVSVFGQNGTDTLNFRDANNTFADSYTLTSNTVTRTASGNVTYGTIEAINLNAGSGANTIAVNSTAAGSNTTVNAGGGNDTINVGISNAASLTINGGDGNDVANFNSVGGLSGTILFDGDAGSDTLNYNDLSNSANDNYDVTLALVRRVGQTQVHYGPSVESVVLHAGSGNSIFGVHSTRAGTTVEINAGAGHDTLRVAFGGGHLDAIAGPLIFNGGPGTDAATYWDDFNPGNVNYTLSGTTLTRPGMASVTTTAIESITIHASDGDNTVNVNSTSANVPVTINGNDGDDSLNVAQSSGNLESSLSNIVFNGGTGTDTANLWDNQSAQNDGTTIGSASIFHAGFGGFEYSNIENLNIHLGSGNNPIDIVSTAAGVATTVNAGAGNDTFNLAIMFQNLNAIAGPLTLNGGAGNDTGTLWDGANPTGGTWTVTGNSISRPGFGGFTHSGIEGLTLNASAGNDTINVDSTSSGVSYTLNGGAGNDNFRVAFTSGNLNSIAGPLSVSGGAGTDSVVLFNTNNTASQTTTITSTQVTRPSFGPFTYSQMESLVFEGGSGNDVIHVNSTAATTPVTARGGVGNDAFHIGGGNLANLPSQVHVDGGTGSDTAVLSDANTSDNDGFTVTATQIQHPGFGGLLYSELTTLTVDAGSGNNAFTVNSTSGVTDVRLRGNGGNDFFEVNSTSANRPVIIDAGAGSGNIINSIPATSARLTIENDQSLQSLTLIGDARAALATSGSSILTQFLTVLSGAQLDIGKGAVIIDYTSSSPLPQVQAAITSGYDGGLWSGVGIISSAAVGTTAVGVGYAESSDVLGPAGGTFFGRTVDATAVLIRQTLFGDANLDGLVNLADFNRLAASFGQTNRNWSHGDFNYDTQINLADFNRLAANFGASAASPGTAPQPRLINLLDELTDASAGDAV